MLYDDDLRIINTILDSLAPGDIAAADEDICSGKTSLLEFVEKNEAKLDLSIIDSVRNDSRLRNLILVDRNEKMGNESAQMLTFIDSVGDPIIAYQGTKSGGDGAVDAGIMTGLSDDREKLALEYTDWVYGKYQRPITVSGHSLGGHLAQYVTVMIGDKVNNCVVFNSLGFTSKFVNENKGAIDANRGKIRHYYNDGDFVHAYMLQLTDPIDNGDAKQPFDDKFLQLFLGYHGMGNQDEITYQNRGQTHDFSDAKKEELLQIINEINNEWWIDFTHWDINYRIEDILANSHCSFGRKLDPTQYCGNMTEYCRKTMDIEGTTKEDIEQLFQRANSLDCTCAGKIYEEVTMKIEALTSKIKTFYTN